MMVGIAFFFIGCLAGIQVKSPTGPVLPAPELHQTAEKYLKAEQYDKALKILKIILETHPTYTDIPIVKYQIAKSYFFLNKHEISSYMAFKWMEHYPAHPTKADVMLLLGKNFQALKNKPQAFYWFLEATKEWFDKPEKQQELDEKLEALINSCELEDLDLLETYADGTHTAPAVHRRKADIFLEQDELEKAGEIAMKMIQDSQNQSWISAGMKILTRIKDEMAVKKGVIGCLLPLSGHFSIYGEEVLNGIKLSLFNDSGQEQGLELAVRDTQGKAEYALAGLEELAHDENVIAIIGPLSMKVASPVAAKAQELGIPIITLTQKQGITEVGDMIFRNCLTPSREVKRLLKPSMIEEGIKRFAILYPDNSYGRFYMNICWDRIDELGGTVTAAESYKPNKTDFAEQIKKMTGVYYPKPKSLIERMKEQRPPEEEEYKIYPDKPEPFIDFDAVFIPDNYQTVAMIAPQLPYNDVQNVLLMGTSLWQSSELIKIAKDYVQGAIFPSGFFKNSGEPEVRTFVADYKESFSSSPGMLAAIGYDSIRLLSRILQDESINTRRKVRKELFNIRNFKGVTGNIEFDEQGELINEPLLLTISGRRMRLVR